MKSGKILFPKEAQPIYTCRKGAFPKKRQKSMVKFGRRHGGRRHLLRCWPDRIICKKMIFFKGFMLNIG